MKKLIWLFVAFVVGCSNITPIDAKGLLEAQGYGNVQTQPTTTRTMGCVTHSDAAVPFTATKNGVLVTGLVCDSSSGAGAYIQIFDVTVDKTPR